jgi:hypothetical protein
MIKRSLNKLGDGFEKVIDTSMSVLDIADTLALTGRNAAEGTLIDSQIELEKAKIQGTDELSALMEPMAESVKKRKKLESLGITLGRG